MSHLEKEEYFQLDDKIAFMQAMNTALQTVPYEPIFQKDVFNLKDVGTVLQLLDMQEAAIRSMKNKFIKECNELGDDIPFD